MLKQILRKSLVAVATLSALAVPQAVNADFTVTAIDSLGGTQNSATAINNSGQVSGWILFPDGHFESYLYTKSTNSVSSLGSLSGFLSSKATGINEFGNVVGLLCPTKGCDEAGNDHAFVYDSTNGLQDLGTGSGIETFAADINDSGAIAGAVQQGDNTYRPAVFTPGSGWQLLALSDNSLARSINNSGKIAGFGNSVGAFTADSIASSVQLLASLSGAATVTAWSVNSAGSAVGEFTPAGQTSRRAYLYSTILGFTSLGSLNASSSFASSINSSGNVVGTNQGGSGGFGIVAVLYSNGHVTDLNTLLPAGSGWILTQANAINDNGQIVGDGFFGGQFRAFFLDLSPAAIQPVPTALDASNGTDSAAVNLGWTGAEHALDYDVYRTTAPSFSGVLPLATGVKTTNFQDTTADIGVVYNYAVKARGPLGISNFSNSDSGYRTLPPVCTNVTDSDSDGLLDCLDACPLNPAKSSPGVCGCDVEFDQNANGVADCVDISGLTVPAKAKVKVKKDTATITFATYPGATYNVTLKKKGEKKGKTKKTTKTTYKFKKLSKTQYSVTYKVSTKYGATAVSSKSSSKKNFTIK